MTGKPLRRVIASRVPAKRSSDVSLRFDIYGVPDATWSKPVKVGFVTAARSTLDALPVIDPVMVKYDPGFDSEKQCDKPLRAARGKVKAVYVIREAHLESYRRSQGFGKAAYAEVLRQLAVKAGGPVAIVGDACARGSTSDGARQVYAALHRAGYGGSGLVVLSKKR